MPTIQEVLREKTHKGDLDTVHERVFYTLTDEKGLESARIAKAISLLTELLHDKGMLSDQDLDELLLEIAT